MFLAFYINYCIAVRDGARGRHSIWKNIGQIWNYSGTQFISLGGNFWWRGVFIL